MKTQKMIKYPSIEQFNTTIKNLKLHLSYVGKDEDGKSIYDDNKLFDIKLPFKITTKAHGTNGAFVYDIDNENYWIQSRSNIITPEKDNAGCAFFCESNKDDFLNILKKQIQHYNLKDGIISLYFEFAGGNIQKGVALCELDKMAYVFSSFKYTSNDENKPSKWFDTIKIKLDNNKIHFIEDFGVNFVEIDINDPRDVQNKLIKMMESVENECPIGKHFGISGIGEGIVAEYITNDGERFSFKIKGEKHAGKSKVKTLKNVDTEKLSIIDKCVDKITPIWRFEQAFKELNIEEIDIKYLGNYIKWVINDTIKEELTTIQEFGLEPNEIVKGVQNIAKKYFFEKLNDNI